MPKSKSKPKPNSDPTSWKAFATMSRTVVGRGTAKKSIARAARLDRGAAMFSTLSEPERTTAQAIELGTQQAAWVIARRGEKLEARAKAVRKAAASSRRPGPSKHAAAALKAVTARSVVAADTVTSRGVLVAEGDSWFDYPFHDVLKELDDSYGWEIEHVAHYGHTVESMAYDGGQLDDLIRAIEKVARRGQTLNGVLLSGGGNDVAGDGFAMLLNHRSSPVHGLDSKVLDSLVETRVRTAYATIISAVTAACEKLVGAKVPILVHGYDYPVADGRGVLGGWGPLPGPWLEPGFAEKGYDDLSERVVLCQELIDRLYAMLASLIAIPEFAHVRLVNLRGSLSTDLANDRYKSWWGNELHPTHRGFAKVAGLFDAAL